MGHPNHFDTTPVLRAYGLRSLAAVVNCVGTYRIVAKFAHLGA